MKKLFLSLLLIPFLIPTAALATDRIKAKVIAVEDNFIRLEDNAGTRYSVPNNTEDILLPADIHKGDRVLLVEQSTEDGAFSYTIDDFSRSNPILILFAIFALAIWLVNGKHGLKSLVNLAITLGIVIFAIIPLILQGWNPVLVTTVGGLLAIGWSIYFSHGFTKKSHAAVVSILISLLSVGILSALFINAASLSGFVSDEASILVGIGYTNISIRGLLLAAIMIGALGVLDDLVISQVSLVKELIKANPTMKKTELLRAALRVGHDHTSAVINTLFLAYASAALPLLILLYLQEPPLDTVQNILNNEFIATELVRALVGSIGILLAMPIATIVAITLMRKK